MEVDLRDINLFSEELANSVQEKPGDVMPLVSGGDSSAHAKLILYTNLTFPNSSSVLLRFAHIRYYTHEHRLAVLSNSKVCASTASTGEKKRKMMPVPLPAPVASTFLLCK